MYYNVDTVKPAENIQNDEGFLILVIQTDWKVAKDLATKAATKANEKSAENVGSKTGQLIGVKFVTNLTLAREKKFMTLPKR